MTIMQHAPHPGEFIEETFLKPFKLSRRALASHLKVTPSTVDRLIGKQSALSLEMAFRLEATLGRSAESWLTMQMQYDLANASSLESIDFDAINSLNKINFEDLK